MGANQLLYGIAGAETEYSLEVAGKRNDEHINPYGEQSSAGVFLVQQDLPPELTARRDSIL